MDHGVHRDPFGAEARDQRERRERIDRILDEPLIRNPVLRGLVRGFWFTVLAALAALAAFFGAHFVWMTPVAVFGFRMPRTVAEVGWVAWVLVLLGAAVVGAGAAFCRGLPRATAWGAPCFVLLFLAFSAVLQVLELQRAPLVLCAMALKLAGAVLGWWIVRRRARAGVARNTSVR